MSDKTKNNPKAKADAKPADDNTGGDTGDLKEINRRLSDSNVEMMKRINADSLKVDNMSADMRKMSDSILMSAQVAADNAAIQD